MSSPVNPVAPKRTMRAGHAAHATVARAGRRPGRGPRYPHGAMDERVLAERLITYDTSTGDGLRAAVGFVKGWLEARDIPVHGSRVRRPAGGARRRRSGRRPVRDPPRPRRRRPGARRPVHAARRGRPADRPRRLRHEGRARGDDVRRPRHRRSNGKVRVRFICVPDEESDDLEHPLHRGARAGGPAGGLRDHRRADRPAHRRPGEGGSRGPRRSQRHRRARLDAVARRQRDPQGLRRVPSDRDPTLQPRVVGPLRPPLDQRRADRRRRRLQQGARPLHAWTSTSATSPTRTPARSSPRSARSSDVRIVKTFQRAPAHVSRSNPYVRALREAVSKSLDDEALSIGRDGASDAISFLRGRRAGGRVRPHRRRPPRPRGVGLDRVAARATARRCATSSRDLPGWLAQADERRRARRCGPSTAASRVSVYEGEAPPRLGWHMWKRFAIGGAARRAAHGDRRRERRAAAGPRGRSTVFQRESTPIPGIKNVLDKVDPGGPQTILVLGSDRRYGDGRTIPARSDTIIVVRLDPDKNATAIMSIPRDLKVEIPGYGTGQDQRGLRDRRPEAHGADGQGAARHPDQPRRQRELRRLPARRQPPRLRLRRHRPALLQRQRRPRRLRDDRPQARLPEALRQGRAGLRALPPHRRRLRARRAPAGVPAPGQGPDRPRQGLRRPQGAAEDLRPLHADRHRRATTTPRSCG